MDCFGTYLTHAQSCDNVRVHSATEWTASVHTLRMPKAVITFMFKVLYRTPWVHTLHMPKAVITFMFKVLRTGLLRCILYTCPKLWCYRMDCFGTYFTHAQSCDNVRVHSTSVHTLRMPKAVITFVFIVLRNGLLRYMPKAVITFVFIVLRNGLLRYILYTCPKLW